MTNDNDEILSEIEEEMNRLTKNDKIVINSLSFLAEDYKENSEVYPKIVAMIENKLKTVPSKLPFLYLIDSIMKNVGEPYVSQFGENLVPVFTKSFEETHDPQHRKKFYDLRKTWIDVFPNEKLFALDRRVNAVDPAWPVASPSGDEGRVIHVNPKFLKPGTIEENTLTPLSTSVSNSNASGATTGAQKGNTGSSSSSPASSSSSEERRPLPETRPVSRPLQLPLPPFYHDVPRPNEVNPVKHNTEAKVNPVVKISNASALRDPRLKKMEVDSENQDVSSTKPSGNSDGSGRKRKADSKDEGPSHKRDIFLIDREGDDSIEKKAKKKGKKTKKPSPTVKSKEDQDMREPFPPPSSLPTLPAEGASDVDMRLPRPAHPPPPPLPPPATLQGHMRGGPPPSNYMPDNAHPPPAHFSRFNRPPMMGNPPPHMGPRSRMPPPMNGPVGPYGPGPGPRPHRGVLPPPPPPPPQMGPKGNGRPNGPGGTYQRDPSATRGLKIDKPRWHITVPGFDEMPEIGVDPRLLNSSRSKGDEAVQEVTINGCSYTLLLDRLQPLINVNGLNHAVRFRVEYLDIIISKRNNASMNFRIPGNNFVRVAINMKLYTICVGGPHHELIIDGVAYPVAFNGSHTIIPLKDISVSVKIITPRPRGLDVLPAIPPHILKWASESYFGPATLLHLPPLNPVERMEAAAAAARAELQAPDTTHDVDTTSSQAATSQVAINSAPTSSLPAPTPNVNVFQLYEQLVKVGLLAKKEAKPKIDLDAFKLNDFLEPNTLAKDDLYEGYQCLQCGLRYLNPESEEFTAHLDYHFLTNNSRERTDRKSRSYFETADVWLTGTCGPAAYDDSDSDNDGANAGDDGSSQIVEAHSDDALNICSVCFEKFEVEYSDEAEAWILVNAVKKDGLFYHPTCVEDAWKGVAVDMAIDPHLALQKVLEGKMDAVFKPDAEDGSSGSSSDDNVEVVVQDEESKVTEEVSSNDKPATPVKAETATKKSSPVNTQSTKSSSKPRPSDGNVVTVLESPGTPVQDEILMEPQTPLKDESAPSSPDSSKKGLENDNPSTPVQDEAVEAASASNSCPGTPVCDEIPEPSTPVKDEPLWN